jgi:hypothetical protein
VECRNNDVVPDPLKKKRKMYISDEYYEINNQIIKDNNSL